MNKEKRTAKLEEQRRDAFCVASISVVIPARDEVRHLPQLLKALTRMPEILEIIVSDGESSDGTAQIARDLGGSVVEGAHGRGPQQNAGAEAAVGKVLWFLHADALPNEKCGRQIARAMAGGSLGGNFRLHFAARGFWPRLFEAIARFQRGCGAYYGDSGIWVSRAAWDEIGGFRAWPLFEDLDFARRLEGLSGRNGQKTACLAGRLHASARRFGTQPFRLLMWWLGLQIGFNLGISPHVLARLYRRNTKNEVKR